MRLGNKKGASLETPWNFTHLQAEAYGRVPVGKGQAAAGFNGVEAAAFLAAGFLTEPAFFFAAGLLTFFLQLVYAS